MAESCIRQIDPTGKKVFVFSAPSQINKIKKSLPTSIFPAFPWESGYLLLYNRINLIQFDISNQILNAQCSVRTFQFTKNYRPNQLISGK